MQTDELVQKVYSVRLNIHIIDAVGDINVSSSQYPV